MVVQSAPCSREGIFLLLQKVSFGLYVVSSLLLPLILTTTGLLSVPIVLFSLERQVDGVIQCVVFYVQLLSHSIMLFRSISFQAKGIQALVTYTILISQGHSSFVYSVLLSTYTQLYLLDPCPEGSWFSQCFDNSLCSEQLFIHDCFRGGKRLFVTKSLCF